MKLIKKLGTRKSKNGYLTSWGLFLCPYCLQEVEKQLSNGKRYNSCGCFWNVKNKNNYKHGKTSTRLYRIWINMKQRCLNLNNQAYLNYGDRGILICNEWLDKEKGYINFKNWSLSNGYKDNLTIDRKDNNLGYNPDNCRWILHIENMRNRGWNKIKDIEEANEIRTKHKTGNYTQQQLADEYNISRSHISNIINNKVWEDR